MRGPAARSPLTFIALTFGMSIGFWLIGAVTDRFSVELPGRLPISSLMASAPLLAAVVLISKENNSGGVKRLLRRAFDCTSITPKVWYAPAVLLMPGVMLVSYGVMRLLGQPLPELEISLAAIPVVFVFFLAGAVCEELGWMGYAADPLRERWSVPGTGLALGVVWGVWHIIPYAQAGHAPAWIVWQCVYTIALRIIIVWLYDNTGKSVFAAILCHTSSNVGWFLFPNSGSHYNPAVTGIIAALAVVCAVHRGGWRSGRRGRFTSFPGAGRPRPCYGRDAGLRG
ncbi:CPBP family intramembrane glutamic endopeptidase [Streptosporangium sp. NPDC023615]|uniref:CPBP family intramembrane glutamic endopeptidase n=1 Tax=Streptosporangium sp. NPDC023615 TaxID=3154794 RepID=UPI003439BD4A